MDDVLARLHVTEEQIGAFCRTWAVVRFELFGSALREDFDAESDVDVLVTFAPTARVSISTLIHMEDALKAILGRDVDVVERRAVESNPNWIRRRNILNSAQLVYAAA